MGKSFNLNNLIKTVSLIIIIFFTIYPIFAILGFFINKELNGTREKEPCISCTANLKFIGLSLKQYAMDNDDWFPDKPGTEGLEQLRSNDYLTDCGVYHCPALKSIKGKDNQKLNDKTVDYIYRSGLKYPPVDGKDSSKIPVLWDKPTNHENYGNVLFLDGYVKGFKGVNWMEQAGIKKKTIEARMTLQLQYKLNKPHYLKRFYTQKELDKILKVGISPQEVINVFGLPMIKHNHRFTYRLDFNHKITPKNKEAIVGFTVYFRDNKVVSWGMIYTSRPPK